MAILDDIVAHKRIELAQRQSQKPLAQLQAEATQTALPQSFLSSFKPDRLNLVLEIKPASPSAGVLAESFDVMPLLEIYNRYATALSVLTDAKYFQGSLVLLKQVTLNTQHPAMCKEFILDAYQIYEARLYGASAVLLIVKILDDTQLANLHQCALALGLTPVVEIQNNNELQRALAINPQALLINNRNLETFDISFETTQNLASKIPQNILVISASGIETAQDIKTLRAYTHNFLIGSTLMKTPLAELDRKLKELTQ